MRRRVASRRKLKRVEKQDLAVARSVAVCSHSETGRAIGAFAELGDQPPLRVLFAAVIAAGVAGPDRRLFRTGLRMALAHSLATAGKAFVKDVVDRTRPSAALNDRYHMAKGRSRDHDLQSMPSGHSAGVVAVAGASMVDYPAVRGPAALFGAAIIAAQLPSRNHFLTDVLAGGAIGLAAFVLAEKLLPASSAD